MDTEVQRKPDPAAPEKNSCCGGAAKTKATADQVKQEALKQDEKAKSDSSCCGGHD